MKINTTLQSAALILLLVLISSIASASITETRITTCGNGTNPAIYDNNVVWQDACNGNSAIYVLDTSTNKETKFTDESTQFNPSIYSNRIVWNEYPGINAGTIYMYNLSNHKETSLFSGDLDIPIIYGNIAIVNSEVGVLIYDLCTKQKTQIYDHAGWSTSNPAIYGNDIVWEGHPDEDGISDIYMYDLSTRKESKISNSGKASNPSIYGNKIVWADERNGNYDIYMCDLSTKRETQITTNSSDSINPVIYGDNLVWQDNQNGNWNIYAFNLVTHQEIHTTEKADQVDPAIYSNKIAWTDYRSGKPDIYKGIISYLPVASFIASSTHGKHSLNVQFTDKSTDAYYWHWKFGDGSTSTLKNPLHKYTKTGKYTVSLKATNAMGCNTKTKSITVT